MLALVALFEDQVETLGIGDVLHHAAAEPSSELVCVAIDAPLDQRDLAELCRPFREDPHLTLVVGVAEASETGKSTGDRLTELVARPLINRYVPELASLRQPLLRRFAVRRSLLRAVSLPVGAGVRMSLLIDAVRRNGVGAVREVTLDGEPGDDRPLRELGTDAAEIIVALRRRSTMPDEFSGDALLRPWDDTRTTLAIDERPPLPRATSAIALPPARWGSPAVVLVGSGRARTTTVRRGAPAPRSRAASVPAEDAASATGSLACGR